MSYPVNAKVFLAKLNDSGELDDFQEAGNLVHSMLFMVNTEARLSEGQARYIEELLERAEDFAGAQVRSNVSELAYIALATYINSCEG